MHDLPFIRPRKRKQLGTKGCWIVCLKIISLKNKAIGIISSKSKQEASLEMGPRAWKNETLLCYKSVDYFQTLGVETKSFQLIILHLKNIACFYAFSFSAALSNQLSYDNFFVCCNFRNFQRLCKRTVIEIITLLFLHR